MQTKGFIYHIVPPAVWEKALLEGSYKPASVKTEGFIHLSTEAQVLESAAIHLADHEELVVLRVVVKHVRDELKWEEGRNSELFPHLYGKLPFTAVDDALTILRNEDGSFSWE